MTKLCFGYSVFYIKNVTKEIGWFQIACFKYQKKSFLEMGVDLRDTLIKDYIDIASLCREQVTCTTRVDGRNVKRFSVLI